MKKKMLALCLVLALCLGLAPAALAGGALEGPQIAVEGKIFSTQEQTEPIGGEGWSYDPATKVLELNNYSGSNITISESDVAIKLVGTNTLDSLTVNDFRSSKKPVYQVKITGEGSLSGHQLYLQGGNMVIESGELSFQRYNDSAIIITYGGALTIKGGKVTATNTANKNALGVIRLDDACAIRNSSGDIRKPGLSVQGGELIAQGEVAAICAVETSSLNDSRGMADKFYSFSGANINGGESTQDALPLTIQTASAKAKSRGSDIDFYKKVCTPAASALTMTDEDTLVGAAKYVKISGAAKAADPVEVPTVVPVHNIAYPSTQSVGMDDGAAELQAYALKDQSGNLTNYVKLRDVAALLDGTAAQFNVGWDGSVNIETGKAYSSRNGQENQTPYSGERPYEANTAVTKINGQAAALDSFILKDDAGGASTYYKLRDLGQALGFNVGWSADRGIYIETDKPYDPNN